jgi:hypothetical protein
VRHDLVTIAAFRVTAEDVKRHRELGEPMHLNNDKLMAEPSIGCYRCETPINDVAQLDEECPGEVQGYDSDGTPQYA